MTRVGRVLGIGLVLSAGLVLFARQALAASPWETIWGVIETIQARLDNLQVQIDAIPAGEQGEPGPSGPPGPQGLPGEPGPAGSLADGTFYIVPVDYILPPNTVFGGITPGTASCNSGDRLISGGAQVNFDDARILSNRPQNTTSWFAAASNQGSVQKILTVYAYCLDITP